MNSALSTACLVSFFLLPLIVLGIRAKRPKLMSWWRAALIIAVLGWLLSVGIVEFHFAALGDQLRAYGERPPEELVRRWASDSGRPFAWRFGWSCAIIYFIPCLFVYAVLQLGYRWYAGRHA